VTHRSRGSRVLRVDQLARVEGEGAMYVEVRDGVVTDVQLRIFEPPRYFEGFLRGRGYLEPPDITARICGICPVAYQMSACEAIEDACGVAVDARVAELRRLLYCGEWIESHALHIYLLHAPDFLGFPSAVELAEADRPTVERGLRLKRAGNAVIELLGGRAIHPVNVRVGGFYRVPTRAELRPLAEHLRRARDDARATIRWVAGFDFPDFDPGWEVVALRPRDGYPLCGGGRIVSNHGLDVAHDRFDDVVEEDQVERSTARHTSLRGRDHYLVGPIARYTLASDRLSATAREAAREAGLGDTCTNPFRSVIVRAVEVLWACDEALRIIDAYEPPDRPSVDVAPRAGTGFGVTEAPRGLLYHRYTLDRDGTITDARIVPPTSQNQATIEHDLWHLVERDPELDDEAMRLRCEQAIRNYDPCISCATHFLDLRVDRS
jgi:sulfhydrogenase subunit alpha